jgi:EpsI family protein
MTTKHNHIHKHNLLGLFFGVVLIIAAFTTAHLEILSWLVRGWLTLQNSYTILILLLSITMVYYRLPHLYKTPSQPQLFFGSAVTILGCLVVVAGKLSATLMIQGFAMVLSLLGVLWVFLGSRQMKLLWLPISYLVFMFSLLDEFLWSFSMFFQKTTAAIAKLLLALIGMPVVVVGHIIELPHITLEVAKVCNGINHIIAIVSLSIPIAVLFKINKATSILFFFASFFLGIVLNGFRVALIGLWTSYYPEGPVHGPFDIFSVSFIIVIGLILMFISFLVSRRHFKLSTPSVHAYASVTNINHTFSNRKLLSAFALATIILLATNFYIYFIKPTPVPLRVNLKNIPEQIGSWQGSEYLSFDWPANIVPADDELKRIYVNSSDKAIRIYIGYFRLQEQGKELVNDRLNWLYQDSKPFMFHADGSPITVLESPAIDLAHMTPDANRQTFLFWYMLDGKVYTDRYEVKLRTLLGSLFHHRNNGSIIIVSVDNPSTQSTGDHHKVLRNFMGAAFQTISHALN